MQPSVHDPASRVLVLIVAYNAGRHLQRCVDALEGQTFKDWRAVVWDNASTDGSVDTLRTGVKFEVVRCPSNLGFAAANNRGAERGASEFIATLNPDAFPEPEWLGALVDAATVFRTESVASLQLSDEDPRKLDGAGDCMSVCGIAWRGGYLHPREHAPQVAAEVFSACAAAALYRRSAFERAGGFEERFFCYYEDVDLGFRMRLQGGRCIFEPAAVVRHVGSATTTAVSGFAEYHGTRNRAWAFLRDTPLLLLPIAAPAHLIVLAYVLMMSPSQDLRRVRLKALGDAWSGRGPWLQERRDTPIWCDPRIFSWSPSALSRRSVVARAL